MRARAGVLCVVLVAVGVLSGCKAEVTKHIVIVGDSISEGALNSFSTHLSWVAANDPAGRYLFTPDTVTGIGIRDVPGASDAAAYWDVHLASVAEHVDPEAWVFELGTNDCRLPELWSDYGAAIDFMLSRVPPSKPAFWVNIPSIDPRDTDCVAAVNAALVDATARWTNLTIVDLRAALNGNPAYYSSTRHLTAAGSDVFADSLHAALDAAFNAAPTTEARTTEAPTTAAA
jgi:GDSL-like Lipase/Acylhydrolase family